MGRICDSLQKTVIIGITVTSFLFFGGVAQTQESKGKKGDKAEIVKVTRQVQGRVAGITPTIISVVYKEDKNTGKEFEIDLFIDQAEQIVHKRTLGEIGIGDIVRIDYEIEEKRFEEMQKDGNVKHKTKVVGRRAKTITFVRPKITGLRSEESTPH